MMRATGDRWMQNDDSLACEGTHDPAVMEAWHIVRVCHHGSVLNRGGIGGAADHGLFDVLASVFRNAWRSLPL
jgi:hypothetical protein